MTPHSSPCTSSFYNHSNHNSLIYMYTYISMPMLSHHQVAATSTLITTSGIQQRNVCPTQNGSRGTSGHLEHSFRGDNFLFSPGGVDDSVELSASTLDSFRAANTKGHFTNKNPARLKETYLASPSNTFYHLIGIPVGHVDQPSGLTSRIVSLTAVIPPPHIQFGKDTHTHAEGAPDYGMATPLCGVSPAILWSPPEVPPFTQHHKEVSTTVPSPILLPTRVWHALVLVAHAHRCRYRIKSTTVVAPPKLRLNLTVVATTSSVLACV